jgi:hypothetical protein
MASQFAMASFYLTSVSWLENIVLKFNGTILVILPVPQCTWDVMSWGSFQCHTSAKLILSAKTNN